MAHSPLLAHLRRILHTSIADGGAAPQLPSVDRRRFLGAAGAAVVATTMPATAASRRRATASIAVVGGGLAGLTCAYRLKQSGLHATVFEANNRFGGRCWTRRGDFQAGQIAEHGGELIDQSHAAIRHLAQQLQLPLVNVLQAQANGTDAFAHFGGAAYPFHDAARDLRAIWKAMHRDLIDAGYPTTYTSSTPRGRQLDAMSIADWITATVPGGLQSPLGQLLAVAYRIEYGAEIHEQSALNLLYLLGYLGPGHLRIFGPSNEKYRVVGGNDLISTALANHLATQLAPQHRLLAVVRRPDGRFRLTFGTQPGIVEETFDHVVFALPFAVLDAAVDLTTAGFSARKLLAIHELGRGANSKLNVQFTTRHWQALGCNGETYADLGYHATWDVSRGQSGNKGILVNYTGGDYARTFGGSVATVRAAQFVQQIQPVLPGAVSGWNGLATLDTWHDNQQSLCSYSYWKVGQYQLFAGVEGEREGNAYFCGEHTSQDAQGYLEGAVETGERAAEEVVDAVLG